VRRHNQSVDLSKNKERTDDERFKFAVFFIEFENLVLTRDELRPNKHI